MFASKRRTALQRTAALFETDFLRDQISQEIGAGADAQGMREQGMREQVAGGQQIIRHSPLSILSLTSLHRLMSYADVKFAPLVIIGASLLIGVTFALLSAQVCSPYFVPFFAIAGAFLPFHWLDGRARTRAAAFAADYPSILLATASSIKVGLPPYLALERATRLLPKSSMVRREVEKLIGQLRHGVAKERALSEFGATIRQPDLVLFRAAFLLVLEHGGKFAPTLYRLAGVCRDREILMCSARVSTTNMRMTANILLAVAPIVVAVTAARTENFWELLVQHPIANSLASAGIVIISFSYGILRRMSNFRP